MEIVLFLFVIGIAIGFVIRELLSSYHIFPLKQNKKTVDNVKIPALESQSSLPQKSTSAIEKKIWLEEEIGFIFKLTEKISLLRDTQRIAQEVVEEVCQFLNMERGALLLVEKEHARLRATVVVDKTSSAVGALELEYGESISGLVWKNNSIISSANIEKDSWFKKINKEPYIRGSFVSVAVTFQNDIFGVLTLSGKKGEQGLRQEDVVLVENLAKTVGITLKNTQLAHDIERSYLNTMTMLAVTLEARDPYTRRHSELVTLYALSIAGELQLSQTDQDLLRYAGLLHDIGKIGVRDEVLLKPGVLTDEEYKQIKSHAVTGEAIVQPLPFLKKTAKIIRHHHERFDGKGYPDGLKGERIELGARILAVADTFDAMTTDRPYRKRMDTATAIAELKKNRGSQFDPVIVDSFEKILISNPYLVP